MKKRIFFTFIICLTFFSMLMSFSACEGGTMRTVTFNVNGGIGLESISLEKNTMLYMPGDPMKEGFNFVGWYYDEALTNLVEWPLILDKNYIMHAKWRVSRSSNTIGDTVANAEEWNRIIDNSVATGFKGKSIITISSFDDEIMIYYFNQFLITGIINGTVYDEHTFNDAYELTRLPQGVPFTYMEIGRVSGELFAFSDFVYRIADGVYVAITSTEAETTLDNNAIIEVYYKMVDGLIDEFGWHFDFHGELYKFAVTIEYGVFYGA